MQKMKEVISFLLVFALVLSGMTILPEQTVQAEETAAVEEYTIYPTPQSITYDAAGGTLTLPDTVNVVYESGIDQATKDRLTAVLNVKNIAVSEVNEAVSGEVNILVGIHGSDGAADTYAKNSLTYDGGLFEKRDAYLFAVGENQITIVGKDTDAAFYAMASLKMILEQSAEKTIRQLQMEDYAVGQYRGFIEGYYGMPWSVEDRISLMNFGGDFKMNTYIFAPKDDPYHNTNWRDPYPEEKLKDIERMVNAGAASKCRFVWAIHPFMHDAITTANYDQSVEDIKTKFQQLYDVGVRQFVISADDASSSVQIHANLCRDMSQWVQEHEGTYNLVFVPQVYCSAAVGWSYWGGSTVQQYFSYFKDLTDVDIMWTGEYVCHPVTQQTLDNFKEKSGKEAFMWLNWPVNDVNHSRLVMGPAENCILNTGGVTGFMGIVTNPLEQAEASKTALFAIADYAWNTEDFDCEKSWEDSFQYIDPGAPEALHELCKHMTNPQPGGITGMAESKEIQPFVTAFQSAYTAGSDLTESGTALAAEFEKIVNAANEFQTNGTNVNLKDEMKPWVDALRGVSEAGLNYVKTAMALQKNDKTEAIKTYIKGTIADNISKNCVAPQLNGTIMAESGAKVLIPFVSSMGTSLKADMEEVLKHNFGNSTAEGDAPSANITVIQNGLGGIYESNDVDRIIDGKDDTYAWFNQAQTANAYVGLDLGDIYRVNTVRIRQGKDDTHTDKFANAILEYSIDGSNYTEIETIVNQNNIDRDYTDDSIVARYIRIRTPAAANNWYAIRDFSVTTGPAMYEAYTNASSLADMQARILRGEASLVTEEGGKDITLKAGEYIGIQLPRIREVTSVTADYTSQDSLVLEGTLDGTKWENLSTGEQTKDLLRIRIRNSGTEDAAFRLNELSLTNSGRDARFIVEGEYEEGHDPVYAIDNSLAETFRAKESEAGSLTWRIADPEKTGPVYILTYPGTAAGTKVYVQTDTDEWIEKGNLSDGLTIVDDLEQFELVKAIKIEWENSAPEIVEMYGTEPRNIGITLNKTSARINENETFQLSAEVCVKEGEDNTVSWSSSNPEVVTVGEDGTVTGVAEGRAVITATAGTSSAECKVLVLNREELKELNISSVNAGSVETTNATDSEGPADKAIDKNNNTIWHSLWDGDSMENLWISADLGAVYDVSQFKYLPRQTSDNLNGTIKKYKLYVSKDGEEWTLASIGEWVEDHTLKTAELIDPVPARYVKLVAVTTASDKEDKTQNFASAAEISIFGYDRNETASDKSYAIDAALVDTMENTVYTEASYQEYLTAKKAVEAVMNDIIATQEEVDTAVKVYRDSIANLKIRVTGIRVTGVPSKEMEIGEKVTVTANVEPENAGNKTVIWTSDKPEVATVENGVITAVSEGEAKITAATEDGNYTAEFTVNVKAKEEEKPNEKPGGTPDKTPEIPELKPGLKDPNQEIIAEGKEIENTTGRYKVTSTSKKTVILVRAKFKKASMGTASTITINGVKYKVVGIGDGAFKGFKKLKKITINKNITSIGKQAFAGCTKLSSVVIKATGLKTIKAGAFKNTSKKMTVKFTSKKVKAKKRAALLKKMKKAGMSKKAKLK